MKSSSLPVNRQTSVFLKDFFSHWKKEWTGCILFILGLRLLYAGIGIWVISSGGPIPLNEAIYGQMKQYLWPDLFSRYLVNPWFGWDTISYLKIAILGYERDATVAFMPLYPLLIRLLGSLLGDNYLFAALLLSTLFACVSMILLYELFRRLYSTEVAWRTVVLYLTFPTAFFLLAGYTESLFLMLVLAFWILALKREWMWAGLCAGLAALTRLQGVILSAVLLWMMVASLAGVPGLPLADRGRRIWDTARSLPWKGRHPAGWSSLAALLIPPLFVTAYQIWLKASGYGTIPEALRTYWRLETVSPWTGFLLFLQRLPSRQFNYMDWIDLAFLILVLLAAIVGLRRLDPAFSLYTWLTLAVLFTRGTPPHLLASYSRYFLSLFPLFILTAMLTNRPLRLTVVILFFSFQILLAAIFLWGSWVA